MVGYQAQWVPPMPTIAIFTTALSLAARVEASTRGMAWDWRPSIDRDQQQ